MRSLSILVVLLALTYSTNGIVGGLVGEVLKKVNGLLSGNVNQDFIGALSRLDNEAFSIRAKLNGDVNAQSDFSIGMVTVINTDFAKSTTEPFISDAEAVIEQAEANYGLTALKAAIANFKTKVNTATTVKGVKAAFNDIQSVINNTIKKIPKASACVDVSASTNN